MNPNAASLRIRMQVQELRKISDPIARLRALRELRVSADELDEAIAEDLARTLRHARALPSKPTWVELGEVLGVSPQRAEQISRTKTTTRKDPTT